MSARPNPDPLSPFHPAVQAWFTAAFERPTRAQSLGWPAIARGESTLILAPTGSGKTLTAFLWCLDQLMFAPVPARAARCRVLYISPLKALAVDVERNLRTPLAGIARVAAARGDGFVTPAIAVRTGDTPAGERARFLREPADILITTPESLYLLLTSQARDVLASVRTVIIDEIHALVPTKRGAHLALSLERLARYCAVAPQRIGLSATQRPLDEVARYLGGLDGRAATNGRSHAPPTGSGRARRPSAPGRRPAPSDVGGSNTNPLDGLLTEEFSEPTATLTYRPVTVVDAGERKQLQLRIEVPVEDMARLAPPAPAGPSPARGAASDEDIPGGPASSDTRPSIWAAIHPRLLELIRAHRSTLVFVNSRRLAERLAGAINELAGERLARAHHGSIAREQRVDIEDQLKSGVLPALVATSSLELGIDMGAIDLVVQIEAPPTVASGLQRIGRGGHHVHAISRGAIFPKFRGDLVACAAVARAMHDGAVEATRYPRNPLDVLAQQIVAMTSVDTWDADELFLHVRRAAPFAVLSRRVFDGVLDMLSGRYPSDEFAELRPRLTWDRITGALSARDGAKRLAIANGGTIPDRGLYGVYLAGSGPGSARVGELDEEMVFETHAGETFILGASTWRIEEITHDRVLVSPAPGEPGKMPFWKGDRAGRPLELGLAIGRLVHDLLRLSPAAAVDQLTRHHDLDALAAENLLQYLRDQQAATRAVPDASTILIERVRDELGDWRICVLSPRGGRIHAPWAMAAAARIREQTGIDVETIWGDDGFVVRFPDVDTPPDPSLLLPDPDEVQGLVVQQLGATALFAGRFRENAARSLLLPKRRPGMRAPLWQQRKRSADLLAVASRYGSFPVLLETYRECLRDFFDMPALIETLADVRSRTIHVATVDSDTPSPFAASLLFSYVASFLYDGDAPLAERRAQALAVDQGQLRELLGDAELRDLLDADAFGLLERQLQRLEPGYQVRTRDGLHDLLLAIGDLSSDEVRARCAAPELVSALDELVDTRRALSVRVAGEPRYIAIEDAARYRDALGVALPHGVPVALLEPVADALGDLVRRYARTHAPFPASALAARYAIGTTAAVTTLRRVAGDGRVLEGEFRPGSTGREWTDADVLRTLRRRSLARLRKEVEPVDKAALGRLSITWHGVAKRRSGADALLDAIEQLQGAPLVASTLETDILPARIEGYLPAMLDAVTAAGEVVWAGVEPLGDRDGRVALYLADHAAALLPPLAPADGGGTRPSAREAAIVAYLATHGASFFAPLHDAGGGGFPGDTVDALWTLVWQGLVTNDSFRSLRAFLAPKTGRRARAARPDPLGFRSRRLAPPSAEGRWTLVGTRGVTAQPRGRSTDATRWATRLAQQLLARHGVLTREAVSIETVPGGFGVLYPVLKALEDGGRVRRGYFVAGLGATQFALPGAIDILRARHEPDEATAVVRLAATDPANPWGATLRWPTPTASGPGNARAGRQPTRTTGASVFLVDGALGAYLARGDRALLTWLPESEPERTRTMRALAAGLFEYACPAGGQRRLLIDSIDGLAPSTHPFTPFLTEAGFVSGALGLQPAAAPRGSAGYSRPAAGSSRRSMVSSPFASRYFAPDNDDEA